jgi:hypothetical protein
MLSLSRRVLEFAAAGSLIILAATTTTPASADEMVQSLGPVGPQQPIIATVGDKRVIAFFAPGNGRCNVQAVVWKADDLDAKSASGVKFSLRPDQSASIDASGSDTLGLKCGPDANTLSSLTSRQFASN